MDPQVEIDELKILVMLLVDRLGGAASFTEKQLVEARSNEEAALEFTRDKIYPHVTVRTVYMKREQ